MNFEDIFTDDALINKIWVLVAAAEAFPELVLNIRKDGIAASLNTEIHRWQISGNQLTLQIRGRPPIQFSEYHYEEGNLVASGSDGSVTYVLKPQDWESRAGLPFATAPRFKGQIERGGWRIGDHTYGGPTVYAHGPEKLLIGKYSSIGQGVVIVLVSHIPSFVSTYPFSLHRKYWFSTPRGVSDQRGRGDVEIGSDVWIGHGALIMPGVKIGDGAVIGAHAIVTKNVPPYGIVAGNPAKLLRYRFSPEVIDRLLTVKWWDWPDQKVDKHIPLILSEDIEAFLESAEKPD